MYFITLCATDDFCDHMHIIDDFCERSSKSNVCEGETLAYYTHDGCGVLESPKESQGDELDVNLEAGLGKLAGHTNGLESRFGFW